MERPLTTLQEHLLITVDLRGWTLGMFPAGVEAKAVGSKDLGSLTKEAKATVVKVARLMAPERATKVRRKR